jgi:chemotaxis methyl-accepting protein methylase
MDSAIAQAVRFRHVVFPEMVGRYGRAMNIAPAEPAPPFSVDAAALTADEEAFLSGLFRRVGISARHYKTETLRRRLPACLRAVRAGSVAHARSILGRNPQLDWTAASALLIGVSSFFRDPPVFEAIAKHELPRLLAGRGAAPLRCWSVACSDGAELYSLAMLLEQSGALGAGSCELHGTDCRPGAVARAAAGAYEPATVRGVPGEYMDRYFSWEGTYYRVAERLRAAARWHVADALAATGSPPGPWDLVLCRNLAIYLQPQSAASLWAALAAALRPGGVLVLGKAERALGVPGLVAVGPCLYRKEPAE